MLTAKEIRESFKEFFRTKGHHRPLSPHGNQG